MTANELKNLIDYQNITDKDLEYLYTKGYNQGKYDTINDIKNIIFSVCDDVSSCDNCGFKQDGERCQELFTLNKIGDFILNEIKKDWE